MGRRKLRAETNKLVKQTERKIHKAQGGSERVDEIDRPLARLIKKKIEKTQMINDPKEGGGITRDRTGIKVNS